MIREIQIDSTPFRQQETTAFGRGGMRHRVTGMSPHMGVAQGTTGFARGAP